MPPETQDEYEIVHCLMQDGSLSTTLIAVMLRGADVQPHSADTVTVVTTNAYGNILLGFFIL
jgi:hypothetical protein